MMLKGQTEAKRSNEEHLKLTHKNLTRDNSLGSYSDFQFHENNLRLEYSTFLGIIQL